MQKMTLSAWRRALEKQAAADKKGRAHDPKKSKKAAHDEDVSDEDAGAMDVESEEEEFKVRRVTSKRIAHENDDEDDDYE